MSFNGTTFVCDGCGADCGDGAIPLRCSAMVLPDEHAPDGKVLKHWCPLCRQLLVAYADTQIEEVTNADD